MMVVDHLLFEGDVNQRQDKRVISNDNKFKLWRLI